MVEFPARRDGRGAAVSGSWPYPIPDVRTPHRDVSHQAGSQKAVLSEKRRGDESSEDGSTAPSKMDEIPR